MLAGLMTSDLVTALRYTDAYPPGFVAHGVAYDPLVNFYHVALRDTPTWLAPERNASGTVKYSVNRPLGTLPLIAFGNSNTSDAHPRHEATVTADSEQQYDGTLAVNAAQVIGADILITARSVPSRSGSNDVTFCGLDEALAVLGLYLRAQGRYIVVGYPPGLGYDVGQASFYWLGTDDLLWSSRKLTIACERSLRHGGDDRPLLLSLSVRQRVQSTLRTRDAVNLALNMPQSVAAADDALASVEIVLLLLMGAVDATARLAHVVLALSGDARSAGWQRERWLRAVADTAQPLAALFASGTRNAHTLTILRLLRNAIHGEALALLGTEQRSQLKRTLIGLPAGERDELIEAFEALGGSAAWGIEELGPGRRLHADPGIFLDQLLSHVISMLNTTMDTVPIDHLPGFDLGEIEREEDLLAWPSEMERLSIRSQLGIQLD
ncbi:MAG TPA: hypothetical protein VGP18_04270 [Solirubrobacteraceae bacterium]|jgi:hypothetical protein|nr:hypothetical protein [Solirubrobacteraceae bacterium]